MALIIAIGICTPAYAQSVRGFAIDVAERPIPGVVVHLLDSASVLIASALTDERGQFRLASHNPGSYRIRAMRIGFRPVVSETFALRAGLERSERVVMASLPVALDTVRVITRSACADLGDSASTTFMILEQVRTALSAAKLTASSRAIIATTLAYERSLDADAKHVRSQQSSIASGYVTRPWMTRAPDELHRLGYVVTNRDNSRTYHAPDIDLLLSSRFVEDHCFRLVSESSRVGIAFVPTSDRDGVPEIRGTLWLDRGTSELRKLEFAYTNLPPLEEGHAIGDMEFARMASGEWAISQWSIRMPVFEERVKSRSIGGSDTRLVELRESGGELVFVRRGPDTLWSGRRLVLVGEVRDSATRTSVTGARLSLPGTNHHGLTDARGRFAISGVLPGQYTIEVRTDRLDSLGVIHRSSLTFVDQASSLIIRIPAVEIGKNTAIFRGIVLSDSLSRVLSDATVEIPKIARTTRTNDRGEFRFDNLPAGEHEVAIRHLGFAPLSLRVLLRAGRTLRDSIVLSRVAVLDTTVVSATLADRLFQDFEANRRIGLGRFLTREDLATQEGRSLSTVLEQLPGIRVVQGSASHAGIASSRGARGSGDMAEKPEWPGGRRDCYAQVYLDNVLVYAPGRGLPVFDINSISPERIEAIEYYAGPAETPLKYSTLNSTCGVLVIWARRSP